MPTPFTGDNAFAQEYSSTLWITAQQKDTRFSAYVPSESFANAEAAYFPTQGPSDDPTPMNTRHPRTRDFVSEVAYDNRKVIPYPWANSHILDDNDMARQKINMESGIMQTDRMSFNRKRDILIRDAALGVAATGKNGTGPSISLYQESVGINAGGGIGYPVSLSAIGTPPAIGTYACGLTLAKILAMQLLFDQADVDPDIEKVWPIGYEDRTYMLGVTTLTNADYMNIKALTEGKPGTVCGFKWVPSNRLGFTTTGTSCRRTFAFAIGGIKMATIGEMSTVAARSIDEMNNWVVLSKMDLGAVRMEGAMVHECLTLASATNPAGDATA